MRTSRLPTLAVSLVAFATCGTVTHSSYLETGGLYVVDAVTHELDGTLRAVSVFKERGEGGLALELDDGDTATVDGVTLARVDNGTQPGFSSGLVRSYEAAVDAGLTHHFTFERTGEEPIARDLDDPPAFTPVFGDGGTSVTVRPGATLTLTWAAQSGATVSVSNTVTSGSACTSSTLVSGLSDPGTLSFDTGAISTDAGVCELSFQLVRVDDTPIGAPFHGGALRTVSLAQVRVTLQ